MATCFIFLPRMYLPRMPQAASLHPQRICPRISSWPAGWELSSSSANRKVKSKHLHGRCSPLDTLQLAPGPTLTILSPGARKSSTHSSKAEAAGKAGPGPDREEAARLRAWANYRGSLASESPLTEAGARAGRREGPGTGSKGVGVWGPDGPGRRFGGKSWRSKLVTEQERETEGKVHGLEGGQAPRFGEECPGLERGCRVHTKQSPRAGTSKTSGLGEECQERQKTTAEPTKSDRAPKPFFSQSAR